MTQPLGQTVRYEWDARDRLAKKILARSSLGGSSEHPEIRYTYETWGPLAFARHYAKSSDTTPLKTISYVRNRAGDLTSVTDDSIQAGPLYTYEVDKLGRTTKTFAKYIPGGDRRLDYAYDARGDLTTFTLNEPNEVLAHVYTYAADSGRIATALFPGESTALTIARWPHDGVKSIDYPGGVRREVDYDVRGPVSEIRIKPPSGTPLIEKWTYTYTDVLNVATMTDGASRQTTYQYDALDRLTQADHPAMPAPLDSLPDVENFTYDGVGNRTMSGYAHDANHRMRASPGHTYDYDDDGNLATRDPNAPAQISRAWDLHNMVTSYADGATSANYAYDPDAHRLKKLAGSTQTYFLWAGNQVVAEYGVTGTRQTRYSYIDAWGPETVAAGATVGAEVRRFVVSDLLDTPRVMLSASGAMHWRAAYESFGRAHIDPDPDGDLTTATLNVRLPGQYLDSESGLHYNWHRSFEPSVGRYLSPDPLGQFFDSHLYGYTGNNPIHRADPSGLDYDGSKQVMEAVGAVTGAGPIDAWRGNAAANEALREAQTSGLTDAWQGDQGAYRHCLWACKLRKRLNRSDAKDILENHEKVGDVFGQSGEDRTMDESNNLKGLMCGEQLVPCETGCRQQLENGGLYGWRGAPLPSGPRQMTPPAPPTPMPPSPAPPAYP